MAHEVQTTILLEDKYFQEQEIEVYANFDFESFEIESFEFEYLGIEFAAETLTEYFTNNTAQQIEEIAVDAIIKQANIMAENFIIQYDEY